MLISTRTAKLIIGAIEISGLYFLSSVAGGEISFLLLKSFAMMVVASVTMMIAIIMISTRRTRGNSGNIALIFLSIVAALLVFLYRKSVGEEYILPKIFILVNTLNAIVGVFGIAENIEKRQNTN